MDFMADADFTAAEASMADVATTVDAGSSVVDEVSRDAALSAEVLEPAWVAELAEAFTVAARRTDLAAAAAFTVVEAGRTAVVAATVADIANA